MISAAEASSDAHGAELLKALRSELGEGCTLEAFGIGGPKLQGEGLRAVVDARELLAMGFVEVLGKLPRAWEALRQLTEEAANMSPAVAVVIDYPDFHLRLAKKLKALGIPVIYYIPPKVWAWRKRRVKLLRERFESVLTILPFEQRFYERENVAVKYVGNPLVDELPLEMSRAEARQKLELTVSEKVLVMMPGSRPAELRRHLELMLDASIRAAAILRSRDFLNKLEPLRVLVPLPTTSNLQEISARIDSWTVRSRGNAPNFILDLKPSQGDAPECLLAADVGLIKSGTSTLEAGILGLPHVVVYKPNPISGWIALNVVRYRGAIGLVNLVAEKPLVREIICGEATPDKLAEEVVSLFVDQPKRDRMIRGLAELRASVLGVGPEASISPSVRAAREVLKVIVAHSGAPKGVAPQ